MTKFKISVELPACNIIVLEKSYNDSWIVLPPEQYCDCAKSITQRFKDAMEGKHETDPPNWAEGLKEVHDVAAFVYERPDCEDCPC